MNTITAFRPLRFDLLFFLIFGAIAWSIFFISNGILVGNDLLPVLTRTLIAFSFLTFNYYANRKLISKHQLNANILRWKTTDLRQSFGGIVLACILIITILAISYLVNPFEIIRNPHPKVVPLLDVISYSLSNTIEELLFRAFVLLASVRLFGKTYSIICLSLLFGVFHLPGLGFTIGALSMILTTATMSLLYISVIYFTKSIWPAVTLHITENLLLHTIGLDGGNNGIFQINLFSSDSNVLFVTLIYETVVIAFAACVYYRSNRQL
jgi:uncharacterized protein